MRGWERGGCCVCAHACKGVHGALDGLAVCQNS